MKNPLTEIKKFLSSGNKLTYYFNTKECFVTETITNFTYNVEEDSIVFYKENETEIFTLIIKLKLIDRVVELTENFISIYFNNGIELVLEIINY